MALLDRWLRRTAGPEPLTTSDMGSVLGQSALRVLCADGQRIDLTARDVGTRLALVRQEWQTDAWQYRDMIGELRYAQQLLARSVAKVRFFAAEFSDDPTEAPIPLTGTDHHLDKGLAADAVANLARLPLDDGPNGFLAALVENLETAGEAWIHGEPDDDDGERWTVRSVSEIIGNGDQIMLAELPTLTTMGQRIITEEEELLRCWTRHPRWGQLADSPLRAMLDVLEEVVLTGREMRAAARSRIASNGVLLVPTTLSLLRTREDDEDLVDQSVVDNDFMRDFTEALTAPIRNEGSPGSVVPLILRGDAEALKEVRHLSLTRDDAIKLMERLQGAVLRMLRGLDIQPEQVTGTGGLNHWSGWLVQAATIRHQVDPMCGVVAACLLKGFLRPSLKAVNHPPDQVRKVGIWYDMTALVESPDRSQDAKDAWDRDAISDDAFRDAMGFNDATKPEPHEYLVRLLSKGRLTPQAVPLVAALSKVNLRDPVIQEALAIAVGLNPPRTAPGQVVPSTPALPAGNSTANPAQPGQLVPDQPVPAASTTNGSGPAVVAAASHRADPYNEAARELTAIDASLTDRITVAADAAIARAVERAEGRIRNAVRKDKALTASIDGVEPGSVAVTLGRGTVTSLVSMPELLAGAYHRLEGQFDQWLAQSPSRPEAWAALTAAMDAAAERALFQGGTTDDGYLIDAAVAARVLEIASSKPADLKGASVE